MTRMGKIHTYTTVKEQLTSLSSLSLLFVPQSFFINKNHYARAIKLQDSDNGDNPKTNDNSVNDDNSNIKSGRL